MSETAYRIRAGRVRRVAIPDGGLRIEVPGERPGEELLALRGVEARHWAGHTLEVVCEIATRMTPWTTWWIAPGFSRHEFAGEAHLLRDMVALRADQTGHHTVHVALHEAWHAAEHRLDTEEFEAVDRAIEGGHDWGDDYCGSRIERRANLFAAWAMAAFETGRPLVDRQRPETAVFRLVYSGGLGVRLARRGNIPASRMTAALRAAAASPERSARWQVPLAAAGLTGAGALAWALPWAAMAPWLLGAGVLAAGAWAMWPDRRPAPAALREDVPSVVKSPG